jgi:predicted enzyme related to lactoylglutathione lyase
MTPRLYRVIIPVRDIEAAMQFYSHLFESEGERVSPGRHYFDLGGTIFALYDPLADGDDDAEWRHHPNQYVYISVSDVEATLGRARDLGASLLSDAVELMPWGERLFYARDPFGTPICFVDSGTLFVGDA